MIRTLILLALLAPTPAWAQVAWGGDAQHPWNRLHRALFAQSFESRAAPCLVSKPGCAAFDLHAPVGKMVPYRWRESGEGSKLLLRGEVDPLLDPTRSQQILSLLKSAANLRPPGRASLAKALLQHDLWERFDAITARVQPPATEAPLPKDQRKRAVALQSAIGVAIAKLAPTAAELTKIRSNEGELKALLPGFGDSDPWLELHLWREGDAAIGPSTLHAERHGQRSVFRIFVRSPDSEARATLFAALSGAPADAALAVGSRVAILEQPLAIASSGALVALPVVTAIESRRVRASEPPPRRLAELGFSLFEGRRHALIARQRKDGGLAAIAPEAPVPRGASCQRSAGIVPMAVSCLSCHPYDARTIPSFFGGGQPRVEAVPPDPAPVAKATITRKQRREDFAALRRFFAR